MNQQELMLILQEGEGYKIEFKERLANIDKEIVAFANSSGERIFLGISDDKKVKGINVTNKLKSQVQDIANKCRPKVKIILEAFENILIIDVREGDDEPYECSSGFYRRIGTNSQKLTRDEIIDFFKLEGKIRFDELIEPKFDFQKDFDEEKFDGFLELAGITKTSEVEKTLINLGVAEKQEEKLYFNNARILFFTKKPQRFVSWSVFTVVLFKDEDGVDVVDRKEITGSLFEIVEKVMDFVKLYAKVAYRFTGMPQREEIYEYPLEAVREAVINSVMHKDYFEHGHNNILKFFPDKIRIENFWVKPKDFKLGKTIFRRNKIISDLFLRIHFGEKIGTGIQRMRDICKKDNAPYPKIECTSNYFYVTFGQSKEYLKVAGVEEVSDIDSLINERQKKAIEYAKSKGSIVRSEYMEINKVSHKTAHLELRELVEKKIFVHEGKGRATKYLFRR